MKTETCSSTLCTHQLSVVVCVLPSIRAWFPFLTCCDHLQAFKQQSAIQCLRLPLSARPSTTLGGNLAHVLLNLGAVSVLPLCLPVLSASLPAVAGFSLTAHLNSLRWLSSLPALLPVSHKVGLSTSHTLLPQGLTSLNLRSTFSILLCHQAVILCPSTNRSLPLFPVMPETLPSAHYPSSPPGQIKGCSLN